MAHRDAVCDGYGGKFARRAVGRLHADLGCLRLAVQGDVAGRGLVPAGRNPDEGLVNFLLRHAHGIIIAAMRCAGRTLGHMAAGEFRLVEFGRRRVHRRSLSVACFN